MKVLGRNIIYSRDFPSIVFSRTMGVFSIALSVRGRSITISFSRDAIDIVDGTGMLASASSREEGQDASACVSVHEERRIR